MKQEVLLCVPGIQGFHSSGPALFARQTGNWKRQKEGYNERAICIG